MDTSPDLSSADTASLDDVSRRLRPALTRYFVRRRLRIADAEDAVQEVFVRLSKRQGLAALENMDGYLFETAASVAVDYFRRARSRSNDFHDTYDEREHALLDVSADRIWEGRQELALVIEALNEMPERTRNIFLLARLEGMRHAEIGQRLGVSVSTVEKQLVKALTHLTERTRRGRS